MKYLFILNDPAYGTERSYNGLRLAMTLLTQEAGRRGDRLPHGRRGCCPPRPARRHRTDFTMSSAC